MRVRRKQLAVALVLAAGILAAGVAGAPKTGDAKNCGH